MIVCLFSSSLILNPTASWATDTQEPVLDEGSGNLSSTSLLRNDTLTFSFRVTDNADCCSWAGWGIYSNPGTNVNTGNIFWTGSETTNRVSGTGLDGTYSYTLQIPSDIAFGTYYLKVQSIDMVGLYTYLGQIGTFTVSAPQSNSGNGGGTQAAIIPETSPTITRSNFVLNSNYKKIVKQKLVLSTLGIKNAKNETISYKISNKSKGICVINSGGIKAKKIGVCDLVVTKTNAKMKKSKFNLSITFTQ